MVASPLPVSDEERWWQKKKAGDRTRWTKETITAFKTSQLGGAEVKSIGFMDRQLGTYA